MVVPALAQRFAQKPMKPPEYSIQEVPRFVYDNDSSNWTNQSSSSSTTSELRGVTDREELLEAMAEMVLVCNESLRRSEHVQCKTKPLSLEYIADRLDVDDPLQGLMVRTKGDNKNMLQGFITWTTFTNWQASFQWNSTHHAAFNSPDDHLMNDQRVVDADGSLARELQATVHCGDVYNEGIVWPQIAEVSLLGALGCGRFLVEKLIQYLERRPPTKDTNYDYLVLQATENSIPFYEKMGFVRVGGIVEHVKSPPPTVSPSSSVDKSKDKKPKGKVGRPPRNEKKSNKGKNNNNNAPKGTSKKVKSSSDETPIVSASPPKSKIVSSPVTTIHTSKDGITVKEVAQLSNCKVWDLIFLNHFIYPGLTASSRLRRKTQLYIPVAKEKQETEEASEQERMVAYHHWNFPDEPSYEPSYMMVRKLNRCQKPMAELNINWGSKKLEELVAPLPAKTPLNRKRSRSDEFSENKSVKKGKVQYHANQPIPPKRPITAYLQYTMEQRRILGENLPRNRPDSNKILSQGWKELSDEDRQRYEKMYAAEKVEYEQKFKEYEQKMEKFLTEHPELEDVLGKKVKEKKTPKSSSTRKIPRLYNKVVTITDPSKIDPAHRDCKYFYVLTFLPDLQWAHLVPMKLKADGQERFVQNNRRKWVLVPDGEGKEMDISATLCQIARARAMRRTQDADDEEWDMLDEPDD